MYNNYCSDYSESSDSSDDHDSDEQSYSDTSDFLGNESDFEDDIPSLLSQDSLEPLYDGLSSSTFGAHIAIMQFALRHKLTFSAIDGLLDLLRLLCPQPNHLPSSLYKFKQFFKKFQVKCEKQTLCGQCNAPICENRCPTPHCEESSARSHLIHIPIQKALRTIVKSKYNSNSHYNNMHRRALLNTTL